MTGKVVARLHYARPRPGLVASLFGALCLAIILQAPGAAAEDDLSLRARAEGKWSVLRLERRGENPLTLDTRHVKGGMLLTSAGEIFVAIGYALQGLPADQSQELENVLPSLAVGFGTYHVTDGSLIYTAEENAGHPYTKGASYRRTLAFPNDSIMELGMPATSSEFWVVVWRRLDKGGQTPGY